MDDLYSATVLWSMTPTAPSALPSMQMCIRDRDNAPEPEEEPEVQNYELLAFEWADAHIFELNARCNEAIGENLSELILLAEELPVLSLIHILALRLSTKFCL